MTVGRTKRWQLIADDTQVVNGVVSPSIREKMIGLSIPSKNCPLQQVQALEFYSDAQNANSYPLVSVDIVSNAYIRMSYIKPCGKSATLGTSIVGAFSFRSPDNTLHFIPQITGASLVLDGDALPLVTLEGTYGSQAKITVRRKYLRPSLHLSCCQVETTFEALKDIELAHYALQSDAFRFLTISSMFTPQHYDGNIIRYVNSFEKIQNRRLGDQEERGNYIFDAPQVVLSGISLVKDTNSLGKQASPGSPDSPSVQIDFKESRHNLAVQAYLAKTSSLNSDSLSVWLEWMDAPKFLQAGNIISFSYTISALPPG